MSEWMQVTALAGVDQWPTRDNSSPAASRVEVKPTGTSGLANAVKTTILGIQIAAGPGAANAACVLSIRDHDASVTRRTINATAISATNMSANANTIRFDVPGGFSVTTDSASTVNIFIQYEPHLPRP